VRKSKLFSHFADRFDIERAQAREFFDELAALSEDELRRSGEFALPGLLKLVMKKQKPKIGLNLETGETVRIPSQTVVKVEISSQLKKALLEPE
jgi:DNA-binding protein HU-beta